MESHRKEPNLNQISRILKTTRKKIKEEKKDHRWNDLQTRYITSQIAEKISPEGINAKKPNISSNSQNIGIEKGQVAPTGEIFKIINQHLTEKMDNIKSKHHHREVFMKRFQNI